MKERNVKIYHHTDMDGYMAAAAIYSYENNHMKANKIDCEAIDHTVIINTESITPNTIVYFVDYSFSKKENIEVLKDLLNMGCNVTWIDHHKTSLEVLTEHPTLNVANLHCFLNIKYCATVLCYNWVMCELNNADVTIDMEPYNKLIKMVDSWDTWKHTEDHDREFNEGFRFGQYSVEHLSDYFIHVEKQNTFIDLCISNGITICEYLDRNNKSLCDHNGFEVTINHNDKIYKCFCLNNHGNSTMFGDRYNEYDIVIPFRFNGEQYVYSLFSSNMNVDCSEIAKALGTIDGLGGGGHAGAAGFQTYKNILSKNLIINIDKNNKIMFIGVDMCNG